MARIHLSHALLAASLLIGISSSCAENPVTPTRTDHSEDRGVILSIGSDTLVRCDSGRVQGGLTVRQGDTTESIDVTFIGEDGTLGVPDEPDHHLGWNIGDTTIAILVLAPGDSSYRFQLGGRRTGSTTLVVKIVHVDHDDFISPAIPISVEP